MPLASAQKTTYQLVRSLNEQWLYFDESYKHYVSYADNLHQNTQMLHFWVKPEQWKAYYLLLDLEEEAYLFFNHNIQKKIPKGKNYLSLDSLAQIYPQKNLLVSLYALKSNFLTETLIVNHKVLHSASALSDSDEKTKNRAYQRLVRSRVSVLFLVLLLAYAFLRQYDWKLLLNYLQISKFFQLQRRLDNPLFFRFFQNSNLLFLLCYVALLTTFFTIMEAVAPSNEPFILGRYNNSLSAYKLSWANVVVWYSLLLLWLFTKYFLITFSARLLGLSRIVNIHFYEYVRTTHWFFLPLTIASILLCLHLPYQAGIWYVVLKYSLLFAHILRLIATIYNVNSLTEFRKLDFYSYICVSEIIPLLVYVKILFYT
ncbi:MAG: hypothetical protein OHK0045_20090 [Raineya sp.]